MRTALLAFASLVSLGVVVRLAWDFAEGFARRAELAQGVIDKEWED